MYTPLSAGRGVGEPTKFLKKAVLDRISVFNIFGVQWKIQVLGGGFHEEGGLPKKKNAVTTVIQ